MILYNTTKYRSIFLISITTGLRNIYNYNNIFVLYSYSVLLLLQNTSCLAICRNNSQFNCLKNSFTVMILVKTGNEYPTTIVWKPFLSMNELSYDN